jgi:hypothetical protein
MSSRGKDADFELCDQVEKCDTLSMPVVTPKNVKSYAGSTRNASESNVIGRGQARERQLH